MTTTVSDDKQGTPRGKAVHNTERSSSEGAVVGVTANNPVKTNAIKLLDLVAATLLVVGGLNWGFIGLFRVDLVATIFGLGFGDSNLLSRLIYIVVGASAVYAVYQVVSLTTVKRRWAVANSPAIPKVSA